MTCNQDKELKTQLQENKRPNEKQAKDVNRYFKEEIQIKDKNTNMQNCPASLVTARMLSCVRLFATPQTVACQAPLSMGFSKKDYWSGLPFPPPGDLPHSGIKPLSPALPGGFFTTESPGKSLQRENSEVQNFT